MSSPRFTPRASATSEANLNALVVIYCRAVERYGQAKAKERALLDSDDTRRKVNTEGVSDVER